MFSGLKYSKNTSFNFENRSTGPMWSMRIEKLGDHLTALSKSASRLVKYTRLQTQQAQHVWHQGGQREAYVRSKVFETNVARSSGLLTIACTWTKMRPKRPSWCVVCGRVCRMWLLNVTKSPTSTGCLNWICKQLAMCYDKLCPCLSFCTITATLTS